MKKMCMIGAFDTKGPEYSFLADCIRAGGRDVLTVNTAVLGSTDLFPVDVESEEVAEAASLRTADLDMFETSDGTTTNHLSCDGSRVLNSGRANHD